VRCWPSNSEQPPRGAAPLFVRPFETLPLRCHYRPWRPTPCLPAEPGPLSAAAGARARGQAERHQNGSIVDAARLQTPRARGPPEPAPPPAPRARSRLTWRGWQLLYTVCNNLAFRNILESDPHTYAVLLNTRVVWTAALSALLLRARITPRKWCCPAPPLGRRARRAAPPRHA
jgi:hypothetical protein